MCSAQRFVPLRGGWPISKLPGEPLTSQLTSTIGCPIFGAVVSPKLGHFRGSENPDTAKSSMPLGLKDTSTEATTTSSPSVYRRELYFTTTASKDIFLKK